jgi:hypothetical protein
MHGSWEYSFVSEHKFSFYAQSYTPLIRLKSGYASVAWNNLTLADCSELKSARKSLHNYALVDIIGATFLAFTVEPGLSKIKHISLQKTASWGFVFF